MAFCSKLGGLIRQSVSGNGSPPVMHLLNSARCMPPSKLFVGAKVVMDRESGRSGGFGSVKFYSSKVASDLSATVSQQLRGQEFGVDPRDVNPLKRNLPDHKRRLLAAKYEVRRNLYKAVCKDPTLPSEVRDKYRYKLSRLPRNSSFTRVRNRCAYTGRPRGVYQQFRMSRIVFRDLARRGELEGIQKASW